ncbi:MAG: tRNA 4-thiouridine(8) synthase ThiI, partial [Acidimicrobiia bacterium]|nr:tRNA 4-thiouridine(8) synthase ThiI [Acidimicrobiia bacterium]
RANLDAALHSVGYEGRIERIGTHRYALTPSIIERSDVIGVASRLFGVASVDTVVDLPFTTMEELADRVAMLVAPNVAGRSFAVRVRRRGQHDWQSIDLASAAGARLVEAGGKVDLTDPDETVSVSVIDDQAFLVTEHVRAAGGLPLGTQDRLLCLISGGFDSVVAAWLLMARGCPVDFVHFSLNCAQSDHAIAVAREMWSDWGYGTDPTVHLVEFQPVKDALFEHVDARMRQVTLKVMMARAAERIAHTQGIQAVITGDALGQVSSQTLPHLVAVSGAVKLPILRPLVGLPKETIIDMARRIGTAELSARAQEVCDLSEGRPVATAASSTRVADSVGALPEVVLEDVLDTTKTFRLADWTPGQI